jgi:hypothetical protein
MVSTLRLAVSQSIVSAATSVTFDGAERHQQSVLSGARRHLVGAWRVVDVDRNAAHMDADAGVVGDTFGKVVDDESARRTDGDERVVVLLVPDVERRLRKCDARRKLSTG